MILVRSPLRITLGGGGTDLPSYATQCEGFCVAAAIDAYVYVSLVRPFTPGIFLKYSKLEHVEAVQDVRHPLFRATLTQFAPTATQLELTTLADIPAGTGLGSSASFTTALIQALMVAKHEPWTGHQLALHAAHLEQAHAPVGSQDAYISAYGGVQAMRFQRNGSVCVERLGVSSETLQTLQDSLLLFYTGETRSAGAILVGQDTLTRARDGAMLRNLDAVKAAGYQAWHTLQAGDLDEFGSQLNVQWDLKRQRSGTISPEIEQWYQTAIANGALGAKLVGAGGGGFLLCYSTEPRRLRTAMHAAGLAEVRFRFDFEGTKVLTS